MIIYDLESLLQHSNKQALICLSSKESIADATPYHPHIAVSAEYSEPVSLWFLGGVPRM